MQKFSQVVLKYSEYTSFVCDSLLFNQCNLNLLFIKTMSRVYWIYYHNILAFVWSEVHSDYRAFG